MPPKFSRQLEDKTIYTVNLEYQSRTSPCEANCPAGNPIQKMNSLVKDSHFEEALEYILARNPFPGICSRVCPHPCERECNRNNFDAGISIKALERACFDSSDMSKVRKPLKKEKTGKKVAIIGSGPAGMTCAYFLTLFGHEVTVFEAQPVLGGMPRNGIQGYRLPKDIVDREIGQILETGVRARTNTAVGKDIALNELMATHDACLIATGAWKERSLNIPGADIAIPGISFLKQINLGLNFDIGKKVVIIGGGGVAFDCAFSSRRLGASEIHIICLESKDCMRAHPEEVIQAAEEGIIIHNSQMISRILSDRGKVSGIEYYDVASFKFDQSGEPKISLASENKYTLPADTVILAIGEVPDLEFVNTDNQYRLTKGKTLEVDPNTMVTSVKGVFAAGDAVSGASSVAQAIGSGRRAAVHIDYYLRGELADKVGNIIISPKGNIIIAQHAGSKPEQIEQHVVKFEELMNTSYFEKKNRAVARKLTTLESIQGFHEIDLGFMLDGATEEATRCFHCGHCFSCGNCVEDCPGYVLSMANGKPEVAFPKECWHCGNCRISCPCGAISYQFPLSMLV